MALKVITIECAGNSTLLNIEGAKINIGNDFTVEDLNQGVKVMYGSEQSIVISLNQVIYQTITALKNALYGCSGSSGGSGASSGEEIRDELEMLSGDDRLNVSAIQGNIVVLKSQTAYYDDAAAAAAGVLVDEYYKLAKSNAYNMKGGTIVQRTE